MPLAMPPAGQWPYRLSQLAIARPRATLGWLALVVLLSAPGLARLELRTDGHALVPEDDPVVALDAEVRAHFGLEDPIAVILETPTAGGVYNAETLRLLEQVTRIALALPGVEAENVVSLATEKRDRVYPGTLDFRPYLDPFPDTPELLATLRSDVAAADILRGTLVSHDERAAAVLIGLPERAVLEHAGLDRVALYRRIAAAVAPLGTPGTRISVVGAPVAEALLGDHILADLALLLPLAIAIIVGVMALGCRRLWPLVLAGVEIAACQLVTFGWMGWAGSPVYLTTAILPVILTTLCLADEIHLFWRYQHLLAERGPEAPGAATVDATMRDLARPICLTSLTTAVGFLSFLASPIEAVRGFGLFAALGILFSMVWTLTAIPAALALLGPARVRHPHPERRHYRAWVAPLAGFIARRPRATLAVAGLATLGLALGIPRLVVQDSWIDGFAPKSSFRQDTERANALFNGTHLLQLHLRFEVPEAEVPSTYARSGPLLDPARLDAIGAFEAFVRAQPGVGGVLGPHSQLTTVSFLWLVRRDDARSIPRTPFRLSTLYDRFDQGRGIHRRREVVDDALQRAVVTVFLKAANYQDTARLVTAAEGYARQHLAPLGARLELAGDVAVSQAMIPAIVRTQVSSILLAPLSCLLMISLLYRSLRTGALAVLPASVAVLWVFGLMGWAGIPLGVATSMFCAIALGIAVDYAIHFLERYRAALAEGDTAPVASTLDETGPAIVSDILAIVLGFGALGLSQVPANARLGFLVGAALLAGGVLTLGGLAAGLELLRQRRAR
jgi:uncharacterized protein